MSLSEECHDAECLTLKNIMTTYLYINEKCMKTEVNPFSVSWTRKWFPVILNGVLEKVLVSAQFSSKLAHGTLSLCFIMTLYLVF